MTTTNVAPNVTAITLRPDDDDSPHVYWVQGETAAALIDAGHNEQDVSQRIINAINSSPTAIPPVRHSRPPVRHSRESGNLHLLLLTDRFDEHSGGAKTLKSAFPRLTVHAGAADVDAINEHAGHVVDTPLNGGETFDLGGGRTIHAIATPGHVGGSMCYILQPDGVLFSGDCVLSRGTTAVHLDQGGDMAAYVDSLQRLADQNASLLLSFHGPPVADPAAKLAELIGHRNSRDESILECLRDGVTDVDAMRERLYGAANLEEWRWNAAREQIVAHLIKLTAEGKTAETTPGITYRLP